MSYIIYGKDNCPFCEAAKALLTLKGLEFSYLTLGKDFTREELLELAPNARTFPQIWREDNEEFTVHIGGYVDLELTFIDEVDCLLREGHILRVTFTKVDGTERTMLCTKNPQIIAENFAGGEKKTDREHKTAEGVAAVFDLDKNDWRSFRLDSVKSYELVEIGE